MRIRSPVRIPIIIVALYGQIEFFLYFVEKTDLTAVLATFMSMTRFAVQATADYYQTFL